MLNLDLTARARRVLHKVLPHVLAHGSLDLCGKTHVLRAKTMLACVARLNEAKSDEWDVAIEEMLQSTLECLQRARDCYKKGCELRGQLEVEYLLARVHAAAASHLESAIRKYPAVASSSHASDRVAEHVRQRDHYATTFFDLRRGAL